MHHSFAPETYLSVVFPALLDRSTLPPPKPELVLQIILSGSGGLTYSYRIGSESVIAERGAADSPDLSISLPSCDLDRLLQNSKSVADSIYKNRIQVAGDPDLLRWLALRLKP